MRKNVIVFLMTIMLLIFGSSTAYADIHNGYDPTNGSCNSCHISGNPGSGDLNYGGNITQICYSCHSGTGSKYDVDKGMINATFPTQGGGFQLNQITKTVTSIHNIGQTFNTVPGSSLTNFTLTCDSCHNPHGSGNFRLLRESINSVTVSVKAQIPPSTDGSEKTVYLSGMEKFCSSCHELFDNNTSTTLFKGSHKHKVGFDPIKSLPEYGYKSNNGLPLELNEANYTDPNNNPDTVSCITCHLSHSTKSAPDSNYRSPYLGRSSLLRLDRSGVCFACHQVFG